MNASTMDSRVPSPSSSWSNEALSGTTSSPPGTASDPIASSQELVPRPDADVPPRVGSDDSAERHPKGRRKRTAAKDKAILEAAYNSNPKPDKAARLEIVNRVSLNEKEVQIWFQNRRQNDRRKSRPLSPQEVAALRYGGMQILSSEPVSFLGSSDGSGHEPRPDDASVHDASASTTAESTTPVASPDLGPWMPGRHPGMQMLLNPSPGPESSATTTFAPAVNETPERPEKPADAYQRPSSQSFSSSGSHCPSMWRAGSSFSTPSSSMQHGSADDCSKIDSLAPSTCSSAASAPILPPPQRRSLSRSDSQVRLSLSLEGKASVVSLLDSPSPSPPRTQHSAIGHPQPDPSPIAFPALRRPSLNRSRSSVTLPPISALTGSLGDGVGSRGAALYPPRLVRHRSRDSLAWELACDNAAEQREDELTAQAEREASGSAAAAISLLRTTSASSAAAAAAAAVAAAAAAAAGAGSSPSSVLQPNGGKRNAPMSRSQHPLGTASAPQPKRAKLGRASSSVARLQTSVSTATSTWCLGIERLVDPASEADPVKRRDVNDGKKMELSTLIATSGNDSDKENWSPDEDGNPTRRNPFHNPSSRRPLPSASTTAATAALPNPLRSAHRGLFGRSNTVPASRLRLRGEKLAGCGSIEIFEDDGELAADAKDAGGGGSLKFPARSDVEVERFMRGEVSPGKKGDLDCVAGLLSLSQGNWR